ncbi:hypothetical protein GCM10025869_31850 [Homoserinibacter gongjuensis]|uniref:Uncharacterized protein n=1 Tax=Homoserinibacter gongjuensis TaxID=1162968 RepID=A0ABQ6JYR3_9MICO|nr:hypothetical protein GCM10025869_31850 [Homoserinibacter gongjuensis]
MTGGTLPRVLAVPALLGLALLVLPLVALVTRVDWSTLGADITSPAALTALGLSSPRRSWRPSCASCSACPSRS